MPHAGHFICGARCQFKLNTYVNGYIISTVGELPKYDKSEGFEEIGCNRLYETFVFRAIKSKYVCCPYEQDSGNEIDSKGYNTADTAYLGHLSFCKKYDRRKHGNIK